MRRALAVLGALCFGAEAWASCTVLSGATVHLPDGPQRGITVVLDGDRLAGVGRQLPELELKLSPQAEVTGATWQGRPCDFRALGGKVVTAGLIEVSTQLGLVEIGLEPSTVHHGAESDPIRAALRAADGYNPLSTLIPVQRTGGITGAVVSPTGGLVSGQSAFVRLAGTRQAQAVAQPVVAMHARLAGASVPDSLMRLRELLSDTVSWQANRQAFQRNQHRALVSGASVADLEALVPVVRGQVPLVVAADRASDLEALLRLREAFDLRLVIQGAAEGWLVADALAAAGVPVIADPLVYGPGSFDQVHGRADNPALLAEAGVPLILSSFTSHNARNLRQVAGNAVRAGLDHAVAVRAITTAPAQAFGLDDVGVLRPGAAADLVVWSGDPLEIATRPEQVWIRGEEQPLRTRQTELREAYRALPGTPRPPVGR